MFMWRFLFVCPTSLSVQRPPRALTSHLRASTTVTRDLGSHWTSCVTSVQTVHSVMMKAKYVVSTPWCCNTSVYIARTDTRVSAVLPSSPKNSSREVKSVSHVESWLMKLLHPNERGTTEHLHELSWKRHARQAFLTLDIFHGCYFYLFAHLFLALLEAYRRNTSQECWHLIH